MKKIAVLLIAAFCLLLSGCSNAFAREEYDNDGKISAGDRYAAVKLNTANTDSGCSLGAAKFDGWITVYTYSADEDAEITADIVLGLTKGRAKVVHIDDSGSVSTLAEFEAGQEEAATGIGVQDKCFRLSEGGNIFKIAGYGCEYVVMEIKFK